MDREIYREVKTNGQRNVQRGKDKQTKTLAQAESFKQTEMKTKT